MKNWVTLQWENLSDQYQGIVELTINRPQALNALSRQVIEELNQAFELVATKPEVKAVILIGSGEKAFVAGADIREIQTLKDAAQGEEFAHFGQSVFSQLEEIPKPVIAAVNGFALGGGLELALACDFIYASQNAKLGLPEVSLGLIPGYGGCVRLAQRVGGAKAKELIMSGAPITADEASRIGLVQKILPTRAELLQAARQTAATIIGRGLIAVGLAKKVVHRSLQLDLQSGLQMERQSFGKVFSTFDQKEGVAAFVEKRPAQFRGE